MTNELSTERAIEALYTVRAYYASLTAGYPKGKDCKGIGDVMCSEIANSCLMAIKALEQQPSEDCRNCKKWNECPCGEMGHKKGTSIGYSIGECKEYQPSEDCISRADAKKYLSAPDANGDRVIYESDLDLLPSVTPTNADIKEAYIKGYDYGVKDWFKSKTQSCEDHISRTELLSRIDAERKHLLNIKMDGAEHIIVHHARRIIEDMPSATPERPKGKWIDVNGDKSLFECSKCGDKVCCANNNYCPNCGSYNGGGEDDIR